VITTPMDINLWRAATDNDGIRGWHGQEKKPMGLWMKAGLHKLVLKSSSFEIEEDKDRKVLVFDKIWRGSDDTQEIHHIQKMYLLCDGKIVVENFVDIDKNLPSLPRVGVMFNVAEKYEELEWFGKGPYENYIDRNAGTPVGLYKSTVTDQYIPYILPQENGNKSDVRWFSLNNGQSRIKFFTKDRFEFSTSHYSAEELFSKRHTNELVAVKETIVTLDHRQRGLGTGSCGPQTRPEYCIDPGIYHFNFEIQLT
jgi:beta-galactosidase